jgi:phosphatidylglycerol:prolipoprotein diacylglycerol transferase
MIWNIDPIFLELGPLEIRYYGLFFSLSLFFAYLLSRHFFKRKKWDLEKLDVLALYLVLGAIIGARLGHIVFYELDFYLAQPSRILQIWKGGLASHGAAIGVLTGYILFLWKHERKKFTKKKFKETFFKYADPIVITIALPAAMVRLGNFFNSEIVGRPTDGPFGVVFERVDDLARFPSQLFEFAIGAVILAILWPLWEKTHKQRKPGFFFGLFTLLYFSLRFSVEFFKEYPLHENFFNLTTGQILSLPFILLGAVILAHSWKKR